MSGPAMPQPADPGMTQLRAPEGPATLPPPRGRSVMLASVAGGSLVLVLVAVLLVYTHVLARGAGAGGNGTGGNGAGGNGAAGSGAAGAIGSYGIATTTAHCPAATVSGAARCPASPECWDGVLEEEGVITLSPLPCNGAHTWQTFAIGIMPSDASTYNVNIVQANPTVQAVCAQAVLLRSRNVRGRLLPLGGWVIQVAPPDEAAYNTGVRTYRCLARPGGYNGARTSLFGA